VIDCGQRLGREVWGGETGKNDGVIGDSDDGMSAMAVFALGSERASSFQGADFYVERVAIHP
jgi:hypothetical protein